MSGLSHHPGKVAQGQLCRGFESRPLRQMYTKKRLQGRFFVVLRTRAVFLGAKSPIVFLSPPLLLKLPA
jgi:hypothetical protein